MTETWIALVLIVVVLAVHSVVGAWSWAVLALGLTFLLIPSRRRASRLVDGDPRVNGQAPATSKEIDRVFLRASTSSDAIIPEVTVRGTTINIRFIARQFVIDADWFFTGLEVYRVDGSEVLRTRSLSLTGSRHIRLPCGDDLEIRMVSPFNAAVWMGGTRVTDNFLRGVFQRILIGMLPWAIPVGVVLGVLLSIVLRRNR
jgi:hypothetical protein